jgi:hypothetical protein
MRSLDQISADFDALTVLDFDYASTKADGLERLNALCEEICGIGDRVAGASVLFRTMERLGGAEIGDPGPLVHTLETWTGEYEVGLAESVLRKPVTLSVWMVNRILNSNPLDRDLWLGLLRSVANNPSASSEIKSVAEDFVRRQDG